MFVWRSKERGAARADHIVEIDRQTDLDSLLRQDAVILFKHSTGCPVSWAAHAQVLQFRRENPSAPVHMVSVLKQRPISTEIARRTGVTHESPQIILLRNGEVADSASHGEITLERLAEMAETVET